MAAGSQIEDIEVSNSQECLTAAGENAKNIINREDDNLLLRNPRGCEKMASDYWGGRERGLLWGEYPHITTTWGQKKLSPGEESPYLGSRAR